MWKHFLLYNAKINDIIRRKLNLYHDYLFSHLFCIISYYDVKSFLWNDAKWVEQRSKYFTLIYLHKTKVQSFPKLSPPSFIIQCPVLIRPICQPNTTSKLPFHRFLPNCWFIHLPTYSLPILISCKYNPSLPSKRPICTRIPVSKPSFRLKQFLRWRLRRKNLSAITTVM